MLLKDSTNICCIHYIIYYILFHLTNDCLQLMENTTLDFWLPSYTISFSLGNVFSRVSLYVQTFDWYCILSKPLHYQAHIQKNRADTAQNQVRGNVLLHLCIHINPVHYLLYPMCLCVVDCVTTVSSTLPALAEKERWELCYTWFCEKSANSLIMLT